MITEDVNLSDIFVDHSWRPSSATPAREYSSFAFAFSQLLASLRTDGQLVPVVVRPIVTGKSLNGYSTARPYELVTGFRRYAAIAVLNGDRRLGEERRAEQVGDSGDSGMQLPPAVNGIPNGTIRASIRRVTLPEAIALNVRENGGESIFRDEPPSTSGEIPTRVCDYCQAFVPVLTAPPLLTDAEEWRALSKDHATSCEWVRTRGGQRALYTSVRLHEMQLTLERRRRDLRQILNRSRIIDQQSAVDARRKYIDALIAWDHAMIAAELSVNHPKCPNCATDCESWVTLNSPCTEPRPKVVFYVLR